MVEKYIGIDIGGMSVKGLVVDKEGNIFAEDVQKTGAEEGAEAVVENILELIGRLVAAHPDCKAIGIGSPGLIDSKNGVVVFAANLGFADVRLGERVEKRFALPVKLTNDANAAALGEVRFGAGKGMENAVLVTLGTGVGGGIVADGKLFEGGHSAGAEIGHMVIHRGGKQCSCGRKGCMEAYSSATALMAKVREEMVAHPESKMWQTYTPETVSGRTMFEYLDKDETAKAVFDWYTENLACGLSNLGNIFRPDVIMLGGGISGSGDTLIKPLQKILDGEVLGGNDYAHIRISVATLGNKAGALGAAALNF